MIMVIMSIIGGKDMKQVPRYITSVPVQNQHVEHMNINETSFPNRGLLANGKYSMWYSMFSKHVKLYFEDDD